MKKLIVAVRNFANAPKKGVFYHIKYIKDKQMHFAFVM